MERINAQHTAEGRPPFQVKTIPQGAATSVWAAFVAPAEEVGGCYCEDCQVSQVTDGLISPVTPGVRPYALDPEHAKALWTKSEGGGARAQGATLAELARSYHVGKSTISRL